MMNNEQAQSQDLEQQEQQEEGSDLLHRERTARGEVRNTHLEAGREQARQDNLLARERNAAEPQPTEETSDAYDEAEPEPPIAGT